MSKENTAVIKNWLADNGLVTLFLTGLTIGAGVIFSEVQNRVGWGKLIFSLVVVLGVYWLTLIVFTRPIASLLMQIGDNLERQLKKNKITWLKDTDELAHFELNVQTAEIWLITSDLMDDSLSGPFNEVVRTNLKKGVDHMYFYPATAENKARAAALHASHQHHPRIRFVQLPDNFFMLVPKLDIVIYNPRGNDGLEKRGFMGIPARGADSHYHAEVSSDLLDKLVGSLLDSAQPLPPLALPAPTTK